MVPMTASRANGAISRNRRLNSAQAAAAPLMATMAGVMLKSSCGSASNSMSPCRTQGAAIATISAAVRPR